MLPERPIGIALVFPPFSTFLGSPPIALSCLSSYLMEHEIEVVVRDLNIDFLHYFLDQWEELKDVLRGDLESRLISEKETMENFEKETKTSGCNPRVYEEWNGEKGKSKYSVLPHKRLQLLLRVSIPLVCKLQNMKTSKLLQRNVQDLANAYFLDDLFRDSGYLRASLAEVSSLVDRRTGDPVMIDFLGRYQWDHIDFVGFSLLAESQFPYAMLMARVLKARYSHLRFVVGGPYVTEVFPNLLRSRAIFNDFDYLVVYEGESALLDILTHRNDSSYISHPNIFSLQRTDHIHGPFHLEDLQLLPMPDFRGFNLEAYKSWDVDLPVYSSKGCTWCRCAFCSINHILNYREREISSFVDGMILIMRDTGISHFQITDEDIPPAKLKLLAEQIIKRSSSPLRWSIQTRFYPQLDRELLTLLREAGCYSIEFGLESGSKKILKMIRKGTSLTTARRIIADCDTVGMYVTLNCMVGFPGEEEVDAEETVAFLDEIRSRHPNLNIKCNTQEVKIYKNSDFGKYPIRNGIETVTQYELSPVMDWKGQGWIPHFMNKYREHLLFSQKSSRFLGDKPSTAYAISAIGDNPRISLSDCCIFLEKSETQISNGKEWYMDSSYLVKMSIDTCQVFCLNKTLEKLVQLLSDKCRRISTLKEDFTSEYPDVPEDYVLDMLGKSLILLNEKEVLTFHAD